MFPVKQVAEKILYPISVIIWVLTLMYLCYSNGRTKAFNDILQQRIENQIYNSRGGL